MKTAEGHCWQVMDLCHTGGFNGEQATDGKADTYCLLSRYVASFGI